MITADRELQDNNRSLYALTLLESSGYESPWSDEIADNIREGSAMDIELIIHDLLMNQVDTWNSYRQKDVQRRLDSKC